MTGQAVVGDPKSEAGIRDVAIPPHIRSNVKDYLDTIPGKPDRLLFPGTRTGAHMKPSSLYKPWYGAREAVGLRTLRWHDLRHAATEIYIEHIFVQFMRVEYQTQAPAST